MKIKKYQIQQIWKLDHNQSTSKTKTTATWDVSDFAVATTSLTTPDRIKIWLQEPQ